MPFIEDFSKRFTQAAKSVGKRTQDAAEIVRLNGRVTSLQDEVERLFNQIGKAYYAVRGGSGQNEAADVLCAKVNKLQAELRQVNIDLDRLRNLRRCPNCGDVQAQTASFCASCGTKMPEIPKPEPRPEPVPEPEEPEIEPYDFADEQPVDAPKDAPNTRYSSNDFTIDWPAQQPPDEPDELDEPDEPDEPDDDDDGERTYVDGN